MQKVFINNDIFDSDADYIIGGFYTDGVDLSESDFKLALRDRIEMLVNKYLDTANSVNREWGYEDSVDKANENLGLILNDNLGIFVPDTQVDTIVDSIYDHPKVQKWLDRICDNIKDAKDIKNSSSSTPEEQSNAEYFTNASFEEFIEEISTIEL